MKDLLLHALPKELGVVPPDFQCTPQARQGLFPLSDADACHRCKEIHPERAQCDEQTLMVSTTAAINVLDFESYISQWNNTPAKVKRRCDYLMWNDANGKRKVVFCDITCSVSEHVEPNPADEHPEGEKAILIHTDARITGCADEDYGTEAISTHRHRESIPVWLA